MPATVKLVKKTSTADSVPAASSSKLDKDGDSSQSTDNEARQDRLFALTVAKEKRQTMLDEQREPEAMPELPGIIDALLAPIDASPVPCVGNEKYFSTARLQDLKQITLPEMSLGKVHRGFYWLCRVLRVTGTHTLQCITMDPSGNAIRLDLHNYPVAPLGLIPHDDDYQFLIPQGTMLAIKEPWVRRRQGHPPIIKVDSPTDVVFIDEDDPISSSQKWTNIGPTGVIEGVEHRYMAFPPFKPSPLETWLNVISFIAESKKLLRAIYMCDNALKQHSRDPVAVYLFEFRIRCLLVYERFHEVLRDCDRAFALLTIAKGDTTQVQLILRLHQFDALYAMRRWADAIEAAGQAIKLDPTSSKALRGFNAACDRAAEAQTGRYNVTELYKASVASHKVKIDAADYTGPVKVGPRADVGGGRGVFATDDIKPGEIVLAVKALEVAYPDDKPLRGKSFNFGLQKMGYSGKEDASATTLRSGLLYKLYHQPELVPGIIGLWNTLLPEPKAEYLLQTAVPDQAPSYLDVTALENTVPLSSMLYSTLRPVSSASITNGHGIFPSVGLINIACLPNAALDTYGDFTIVRAITTIKAGTEVVLPPTNLDLTEDEWSYEVRRAHIKRTERVECVCEWCLADRASPLAVRQRRSALCDDFVRLAVPPKKESHGKIRIPFDDHDAIQRLVSTTLEPLIAQIGKTYPSTYTFPHIELSNIYHVMGEIHRALAIHTSGAVDPVEIKKRSHYENRKLEVWGVRFSKQPWPASPILCGPRLFGPGAIMALMEMEAFERCHGSGEKALELVNAYVAVHHIFFGGGLDFFKLRYSKMIRDTFKASEWLDLL